MLYGGGQLFASIGMFVAGGYGAPRKAPTSAGVLVDTAAAGRFVHGVGALFAVIGGAAFVVVAIRALRRANPAPASA
jgi:heme/copper-type cytochrome/quinol oxidase subunit 1